MRAWIAFVLLAASGFAAVGYQMIWTRLAALWLGHEAVAVLAVITAFFGGLAGGALLLGPRIARSANPARWMAACEASIALWSALLVMVMEPLSRTLLALTGATPEALWQWSVAFGGSLLLLLPATLAMGATLPAMERVLAGWQGRAESIAALYAANTLGAVAGVLGVAFVLLPALGLSVSAMVCAMLNLGCAAAVLALDRAAAPAAAPPPPGGAPRRLAWLLLATGFLGIGYEVLVVRVLSQHAENTLHTYAIMLAVYLAGTSAGAATGARLGGRRDAPAEHARRLLLTLAAACIAGIVALAAADTVKALLRGLLGPGMGAALSAEAVLALLAFLPPTLVMGALFSHLGAWARESGLGFGRALGINTLGAAMAPVVFGVAVVPRVGTLSALLALVAGYLILAGRWLLRRSAGWAMAALTLALMLWRPSLVAVDVPAGGRLVSHAEGISAEVSIVEDGRGVASLHIDNRQQEGSTATRFADARQGLIPLLLHGAPRRALFLGLGTGATAAAAAQDPRLQVDAVELLPEVIAASNYFLERLGFGADPPRLHRIAADARRFARTSTESYDLVVADNVHPARNGSAALYTVEHFAAVRARLASGGVFCQWLPLHQLDLDTLRSIVGAYLTVFPNSYALLATYSLDTPVVGLIARGDGARLPLADLRRRIAMSDWPGGAADLGVADQLALFGSFIAGPPALADFAAGAAINTDDRPVVAYLAPRNTYAAESAPRDRLIALLGALRLSTAELFDRPPDGDESRRLAAYWAARDRFIAAGREVVPSADPQRMLAQVREPLLAVLRSSPDFRPAYDPLLRLAIALGERDPAGARALLEALRAIQPARQDAAAALARLARQAG